MTEKGVRPPLSARGLRDAVREGDLPAGVYEEAGGRVVSGVMEEIDDSLVIRRGLLSSGRQPRFRGATYSLEMPPPREETITPDIIVEDDDGYLD